MSDRDNLEFLSVYATVATLLPKKRKKKGKQRLRFSIMKSNETRRKMSERCSKVKTNHNFVEATHHCKSTDPKLKVSIIKETNKENQTNKAILTIDRKYQLFYQWLFEKEILHLPGVLLKLTANLTLGAENFLGFAFLSSSELLR